MPLRVPETNKKSGVSYAVTDDGLELPVIDVTHPDFAASPSDEELATLTDAYLDHLSRMRAIPLDDRKRMAEQMLETSIIGRGLMAASGTFLSGMNTYLMKLGPENLGQYASAVDRQIAAALPPLATRMRLRDVAMLQAEALGPQLAERPGRPLQFVNIAGGPAVDSLNALILLRRDDPQLVEHRAIVIHVYDQDASGPAFGSRALDALRLPGAKLHGLDVTFRRVPYNWADTSGLIADLATLDLPDSVWVASSEGGLFEYGSDDEIVANLEALRTVEGGTVSGSVTRGDGVAVANRDIGGGVATIPRTLDAFNALARRAGWTLDRAIIGPLSFNVRLK